MSAETTAGNGRALIPVGPKGVELKDIDSMFRFAKCYIQSNLAPASFKNEQQLVIAWAKAAELGLLPLQAVEGMSIINNRVGIMGDLALAMVEASGLLEQKRVVYSGEGSAEAGKLKSTPSASRKRVLPGSMIAHPRGAIIRVAWCITVRWASA